MKLRALILLLCICQTTRLLAQENFTHEQRNFQINLIKAEQKPTLDGKLDEPVWQQAKPADQFWLKFPNNDQHGADRTEVRLCYDKNFLYVGAICYDSTQRYLVQSLKRDQGLRTGDGIAVILDPFNQKTNGFFFAVSAFNSQSEDLLVGGNDDIDFSWDNKWFSQTKIYPEYWVAEMAIPLNILRYDPHRLTWGINFIRSNRKRNEFYTWTRMPVQFPGFDLGYTGQLHWPEEPPKSGTNISVNPYIAGGVLDDREDDKKGLESTLNVGFDAKVAVTPSLNLDLTVNPDFSQVDVDRQVTNLSRFDIFFPERRIFFLENNDLFSAYGIPPVQPFYSRRIGAKNGVNVPILFGARLSGNITKTTRIGLMNIQTGKKDGESADNFTAFSFNQRVLSRSNISGYFLNREGFPGEEEKKADPLSPYGRNAGMELEFTDATGNWNGWYGQHLSFKPGLKDKNQFINFGGEFSGRNVGVVLDFGVLGENYYADMGFENFIQNQDDARDTVIRLGTQYVYNELRYTFLPKASSKFNQIRVGLENFYQTTRDGKPYEESHTFVTSFNYRTTASWRIEVENRTSHLRFPFRFTDGDPIPARTYRYTQFELGYNSDLRRDFSWQVAARLGTFYNAGFRQFRAVMNIRKQPDFTFGLTAEYNLLDFPEPYKPGELLLLSPSFEYNFSTNLFWTTFFQYNTQANNININSRLQWRYRPMSDLFIVYTDNYFTDPLFKNKNRGLVCKLNYWLNW
jgi:hypothetical protein